jgi:hypothetical protein
MLGPLLLGDLVEKIIKPHDGGLKHTLSDGEPTDAHYIFSFPLPQGSSTGGLMVAHQSPSVTPVEETVP